MATDRFLRVITVALLVGVVGGCTREQPLVYVPVKQTAVEQYAHAMRYEQSKNIGVIGDTQRFMKARQRVVETYGKVAEYFPDDREFTPLAKLDMIERRCGLDNPRAVAPSPVLREGIAELAVLASDYPEHEFIQAKSLYVRGMLRKRMGEYGKAQEYFKVVCDTYLDHRNDKIEMIAKRSCYFYDQTYEND